MFRQGWRMAALAGAVVVCLAGCQQAKESVGGARARRTASAPETVLPVFDSMPQQVEMAKPATLQPKTRLHPPGSAIPKDTTATSPTREHPSGSAIPKDVEPTPPTVDESSVGQSADNPYRNPGAEEWEKLPRHNNSRLVKWRSLDINGRHIEIKGIPAPHVKSILFHWGDGTSTRKMPPPASHTYAEGGFYRIDIVIEDIRGKDFRDGTTIEIEDDSSGAASQGDSGPAPQSGTTGQGPSGP